MLVSETTTNRICHIDLDDSALPETTPDVEQERRVAMFDLIEENHFELPGDDAPEGPYRLGLAIREKRLVVAVSDEADNLVREFYLSLGPFRQVVKDYYQICESYFDAVKTMPPAQIETIDMARRGIHNEGARILTERLEGKAIIDNPTARRLFTLISVLHFGG